MDLTKLYFRSVLSLADIIGDNRCVICSEKGTVMCPSHFSFYTENSILRPGEHWWFWYYEGKARSIILDIKIQRRFRVAYTLGIYMGEHLAAKHLDRLFSTITYVPHHHEEFAQRMFSLPYLLALGISDVLEKPLLPLFIKQRPHSQHVLSRSQRIHLLKGVYNINRKLLKVLSGVLIVDDIITTGSTLQVLVSLLKKSGIKDIHTLTLAKTPKWSDVV